MKSFEVIDSSFSHVDNSYTQSNIDITKTD